MNPVSDFILMSTVPQVKRGRGRNWSSYICRLLVGQRIFFAHGTNYDVELIRQSCRYLRRTKGFVYKTKRFHYPGATTDVAVRRVK